MARVNTEDKLAVDEADSSMMLSVSWMRSKRRRYTRRGPRGTYVGLLQTLRIAITTRVPLGSLYYLQICIDVGPWRIMAMPRI